ncbi:MAG: hypothetical protein LUD77_06850, partial [Clostridiales bacterium]|nr:hypothetical protein [Clostridiales bacterium]
CKENMEPEKDVKIKRTTYFLRALALIAMFALSGIITDMGRLFIVWAVIIVIYTIIKMFVVCRLYNKGE